MKWLTFQFGKSPQAAIAVYVNHVSDGVDLLSVWEQLQGQFYLGDGKFAEVLGACGTMPGFLTSTAYWRLKGVDLRLDFKR